MGTTLNKDVLKRTAGLLSQIDMVASTTSVAERVNRVIESAARGDYCFLDDSPHEYTPKQEAPDGDAMG